MSQCKLAYLPTYEGVDFTNKPFVSGIPLSEKGLVDLPTERCKGGKKVRKQFLMPPGELQGLPAVEIFYTDVTVLEDGTVQEASLIIDATHIKEQALFYDDLGHVWYNKVTLKLIKNKKALSKSRANWSINDMIEQGEALGASSIVKTLFEVFHLGFDEWKDLGDPTKFIEDIDAALINDQHPMYGVLNMELPVYAPKRFYDSIKEELTGTPWVNPNIT